MSAPNPLIAPGQCGHVEDIGSFRFVCIGAPHGEGDKPPRAAGFGVVPRWKPHEHRMVNAYADAAQHPQEKP